MLESLSFTFLLRGGREEDERKMVERVECRGEMGMGGGERRDRGGMEERERKKERKRERSTG